MNSPSKNIPRICWSQGTFCLYKLPSWRPSCPHSYFICIWSQAKCLLLDSNFIANNLRKKMRFYTFLSITHNVFTYNCLHLGRHLGYIEMLYGARVTSLRFYKNNVCTIRINREKKFKIKFQVLLKFPKILLDYNRKICK